MKSNLLVRFSMLLLLIGVSPGLVAQTNDGHPCSAIAVPAERLACYDEAFPLPPQVIAAAAERAKAEFGWSKRRELLPNSGHALEQADPESIESTVVEVVYGQGGQRSFTLENGQVWTLAEARSSGQVKAGDTVQVRKGVLSGYGLVTPGGVVLRVSRVR